MNSYSEFNFSHLSAIVKLDELSTSLNELLEDIEVLLYPYNYLNAECFTAMKTGE